MATAVGWLETTETSWAVEIWLQPVQYQSFDHLWYRPKVWNRPEVRHGASIETGLFSSGKTWAVLNAVGKWHWANDRFAMCASTGAMISMDWRSSDTGNMSSGEGLRRVDVSTFRTSVAVVGFNTESAGPLCCGWINTKCPPKHCELDVIDWRMSSSLLTKSVLPSVTFRYCDYIGWNSSKIILWLISLRQLLTLTLICAICATGTLPKLGWNFAGIRSTKTCNISEKVQYSIRLLWWTDRKLHCRFRLAPKWMTLQPRITMNGRNVTLAEVKL